LGVALHLCGDLTGARNEMETAVRLRPKDPTIFTNFGCLCASMGALTEAVSWHRKALELAPNFTSAMNNLAIVYKYMGNLAEFHSIYKQLVAGDLRRRDNPFEFTDGLALPRSGGR
jgi:Flp pilus assembly protein TadD